LIHINNVNPFEIIKYVVTQDPRTNGLYLCICNPNELHVSIDYAAICALQPR